MKKGLFAILFLCAMVLPLVGGAQALTEADKTRLRAEYDKLQEEILQWQKVLDETRAKKNTLQGDVTALNAQIKKAEAEIKQRNTVITRLAGEINQKVARIGELEQRIERGRESLAKLMREKNENESRPLAILILSAGNFSSFFSDIDAIDSINRDLQVLFEELRDTRTETEIERQELDQRKNEELDAKYVVEEKKKTVSSAEAEKKQLLAVAAQQEKSYQEVLADRQRRAETIRAALFELRDAEGIPFATALEYASVAEQATGVRAAFILGILRQESNLGANVGQCYLSNATTGAGVGKNTGRAFGNVMHPTRDVPPFLDLTDKLGRNPYSTVVSCPQSIGYGGAMGPSQFIPSTWKLYQGRPAAALGVPAADPWIPKHAIMATSLFLKDLGAGAHTYTTEREAAGRYYAGGNWATLGLGYAASVLAYATEYQENIDFLKNI